MIERRIEYDKYIIPLSESNPFESDEFVKILRKSYLKNRHNTVKISDFDATKNFVFL
jgi:hypothetical protein